MFCRLGEKQIVGILDFHPARLNIVVGGSRGRIDVLKNSMTLLESFEFCADLGRLVSIHVCTINFTIISAVDARLADGN